MLLILAESGRRVGAEPHPSAAAQGCLADVACGEGSPLFFLFWFSLGPPPPKKEYCKAAIPRRTPKAHKKSPRAATRGPGRDRPAKPCARFSASLSAPGSALPAA